MKYIGDFKGNKYWVKWINFKYLMDFIYFYLLFNTLVKTSKLNNLSLKSWTKYYVWYKLCIH